MASSVSGPEPAFARIRRLRTFPSAGRLMPGLQTDSGSDLNRSGTIPGVPGGTLDAVPTGPAVTLTEVNLQQALGELKVKPGSLSGRKSHGLFLPNTTAERTLTNNKLRTKNTNSSPAFLVAFRRIYGQQTYSQFNFKGSSEEDRQAKNSREYRNKETVFSQGDASDAMFYIQDGNVKLTVTSRRGKIAALAILRQGDFFGERCLVSRSLRTFTATAIQQSTVARVKRSTMVRIISKSLGSQSWLSLICFLAFSESRKTWLIKSSIPAKSD